MKMGEPATKIFFVISEYILPLQSRIAVCFEQLWFPVREAWCRYKSQKLTVPRGLDWM
jgi:hypothetical protein